MSLLEEQILNAYQRQIAIKRSGYGKRNGSEIDIEDGEDDEALLGDIALRLMLKNELEAAAAMEKTDTECWPAGGTQPILDHQVRQKNVHARKMMKIQESSAGTPSNRNNCGKAAQQQQLMMSSIGSSTSNHSSPQPSAQKASASD